MSGPIPRRVDVATKAGLLELLDEALDGGWTVRRVRSTRVTRAARTPAGRRPSSRAAGRQVSRLLARARLLRAEESEILALFDEWGRD